VKVKPVATFSTRISSKSCAAAHVASSKIENDSLT
jgi:hypothetical protein